MQPGRLLPIDSAARRQRQSWLYWGTGAGCDPRGGGGVGGGRALAGGVCGVNGIRVRWGGWVGDPTISAKNTLCNTVGILNYSLYP